MSTQEYTFEEALERLTVPIAERGSFEDPILGERTLGLQYDGEEFRVVSYDRGEGVLPTSTEHLDAEVTLTPSDDYEPPATPSTWDVVDTDVYNPEVEGELPDTLSELDGEGAVNYS